MFQVRWPPINLDILEHAWANPTNGSWIGIKKIARYLIKRQRYVIKYVWNIVNHTSHAWWRVNSYVES